MCINFVDIGTTQGGDIETSSKGKLYCVYNTMSQLSLTKRNWNNVL